MAIGRRSILFVKLTVVDTHCVAVVRTDIGYVTITSVTKLSRSGVESVVEPILYDTGKPLRDRCKQSRH